MIVDVFAGPGGWDVGAALAGLEQPIGVEIDEGACRTRAAAGHLTVRADVATYPPEAFAGAGADGLIASPPCQEFSPANRNRRGVDSDRGALVHQVMRWATIVRPRWIACEQVPPVLPIWRHYAHQLRGLGYDAHAAVLCAADYGVPQKRHRAILIARRDAPARWPTPTHDEHTRTMGRHRHPDTRRVAARRTDTATDPHPAPRRHRPQRTTPHRRGTRRVRRAPSSTRKAHRMSQRSRDGRAGIRSLNQLQYYMPAPAVRRRARRRRRILARRVAARRRRLRTACRPWKRTQGRRR